MYIDNTRTGNKKMDRMQNQINALRRRNVASENFNKFLITGLGLAIAIIIGLGITLITSVSVLKSQISSLETEKETLLAENKELSEQYNEVSELLAEVSEISVELDKSNAILKSDNKEMSEKIAKFEEREELHDKYDYAIVRTDGTRTDFSYSELKTLEELTEEKGLSKETNDLILAIAMTESNGREDIVNLNSTATGYGQFLSSTGKFVYTKLMGHDTYTHELAKNGETNITMMVEYVDYLDDKYNGDTRSAMIEYRGTYDQAYLNKIDRYLLLKDTSLNTIEVRN